MKYLLAIIGFTLFFIGCNTGKKITNTQKTDAKVVNDTIRIANDALEYEIIIFEPGFQGFLASQPQRGFYGQTYLENRNRLYVTQYNIRVRNPLQYDFNLYPQAIDYKIGTDYGYEVNYLLYNYFVFFSRKYNQKFTGVRN